MSGFDFDYRLLSRKCCKYWCVSAFLNGMEVVTEDFRKRNNDVRKPCHLREVAKFHIDAFNYMVREGIFNGCVDISPVFTKTDPPIKISISCASMASLQYPMNLRKHRKIVYPSEVRMRGSTYFAELHLQLLFERGSEKEFTERVFYVPLMLKSNLCYLNGMSDQQLVNYKEDINDPGGYFIVKGQERIIRLFLTPRQNFPFALRKNTFKALKSNYTECGVYIRSVKGFHSQSDVYLHYLNNDSIEIRLFLKRYPYCIPLMLLLKALIDKSDYFIVQEIIKFRPDDIQMRRSLIHMLRLVNSSDGPVVRSHQQAKNFIGTMFCPVLGLPPDTTTCEAADFLFRKCLLIHLET
ncbi:DNA-directed RNA polymerase I subunit RPA2, partial [Stegodyphus mimosarum]